MRPKNQGRLIPSLSIKSGREKRISPRYYRCNADNTINLAIMPGIIKSPFNHSLNGFFIITQLLQPYRESGVQGVIFLRSEPASNQVICLKFGVAY